MLKASHGFHLDFFMEVGYYRQGFYGLFALLWEILGIFGENHVTLPYKVGGGEGGGLMLHRYCLCLVSE